MNISGIYAYHNSDTYELNPNSPFRADSYQASYDASNEQSKQAYISEYIIRVKMANGDMKYYQALDSYQFLNPARSEYLTKSKLVSDLYSILKKY